jgi:hypothetical protein
MPQVSVITRSDRDPRLGVSGAENKMVNHPNRNRQEFDRYFSPLESGDEETVGRLIARYGFARIHASLIRKMPKDLGIIPDPNFDPDTLGLEEAAGDR